MPIKSELFNVGFFTKTSGFEGDLILLLDVDEPQRYANLDTLFIEVNSLLSEQKIAHYQLNNNGTATVRLQDIDAYEQARKLIKTPVYLPLSFLPPLVGNNFYFHEIIGFNVQDKNYGNIGIVESVIEMVHQNLLQVKKDRKEILIPLKDEFIELVERKTGTLYINAPDGLIDIYLGTAKPSDEDEMDYFRFDSSD